MREVVMKIEELGDVEKVRINMNKYYCSCDNDLTEILLETNSEINSIYHELSYKQIKDSVVKEVKDHFELSKKRSEILETQLTTRISQLVTLMDNSITK